MGMFDWIRSSYDLGEQFTNVECQTKDMEDGIGGTLSQYWIDPAGYLWYSDYHSTHTFELIEEDDPRYNHEMKFLNYEWVPTGKHGKLKVYPITKYVEIYPATWDGQWNDWPRLRLHFKYGKLMDIQDITHERQISNI